MVTTMSLLKSKRVWWAAGVIVTLLAIIQTATYLGYADTTMPQAGIRSLTDSNLLRDRDFVVVDPETWATLTEGQKAALSEELGRLAGTVYHSLDEVPEGGIHWTPITDKDRKNYQRSKQLGGVSPEMLQRKKREIESGRKMLGLNGGVRLRWHLENHGPFWMKCRSRSWVSRKGAEYRSDVYLWVLGAWVRIYNTHFSQA